MKSAEDLSADAGIHCIPLPTPFAVGRVNCYLIEDEPLTLVDAGPNSGTSLDALERGIRERGHAVEDLGLVVVTHQHIDHIGLVQLVADRSGAEVAAIDVAVEYMASFGDDAARDDDFAAELMLRHGMPADVVVALRSVSASFRAWGAPAKVTKPLSDGGTLELRDRSLAVFHRPGHSPSDTIFWDADRKVLLAADHLIAHISSNALISRPLDGSNDRPRSLEIYIESMKRTREIPAELVLSGHGEPITDHRALIDSRLAGHERRARKIGELIERLGPVTAYDLAQELWGNIAVTQAFLTLSEVIGHIDLLIGYGQVAETEIDGVIRFATAR